MTELDRVGNSNLHFRGFPSFLQVCEKSSPIMRKNMEFLYGDGAAIYL